MLENMWGSCIQGLRDGGVEGGFGVRGAAFCKH